MIPESPGILRAGWMEWRDLIFLHYRVAPEVLAPRLPGDLSLDLRDGSAWVSILAFDMLAGFLLTPRALALATPEVNVRTYVRSVDGPGVYFLSLDIGSIVAMAAARLSLGLPYFAATIAHRAAGDRHTFESDRKGDDGHLDVAFEREGELFRAPPGTLDDWLTARWALYTDHAGALLRVQVRHSPFELAPARLTWLEHDLFRANEIAMPPDARPELVHYAPVADVTVFRPELVSMVSGAPELA